MAYKVSLTPLAFGQLESCYLYILYEFNDVFAAQAFDKDAEKTIARLATMAESQPVCEDPLLHKMGYRVIHFEKHRYKIVYLIVGDTVEIHGIYHNLQNLEKQIRLRLD